MQDLASDDAECREARSTALRIAADCGVPTQDARLVVSGRDRVLPVRHPLGVAAAGVLGACGLALDALTRARGAPRQTVGIDIGQAAYGLVSFRQLRLDGRPIGSPGDANPLVGIHRCRDGRWFALHGGFDSLREPTLRVLGAQASLESVAAAVSRRDGLELEELLAAHRLCGVLCRSATAWQATDAGRALAAEPLVAIARIGDADAVPPCPWHPGEGAMSGVRVLDCTRILAGPTCGRLLAAAGADVVVSTPARLPNVESYALETSHGKRLLEADLDDAQGRRLGLQLADACDVLVDSFRPGALARRGLGPQALAARRRQAGIVYVSINCYGHAGPWIERPGWELMGQAATGLAVGQGEPDHPLPLWTYPCDYLTGYLGALGVARALQLRSEVGGSWHVKVSLARTGMYAEAFGTRHEPASALPQDVERHCRWARTDRGPLRYLPVPLGLDVTPLQGWRAPVRAQAGASGWPAP